MQANRTRFIVGVILGLALLGWFLWSIHWPELRAALARVDPARVALAALILFGEFILRTLRWGVLLRPVTPGATFRDLFAATVVGAAVNTLLPARAGDVARPLVANRRTGTPLSSVVATNVVERVFDLVGLLFVFVLMMFSLPDTVGPEGELVQNLRRYGTLFGSAGLLGLVFFVVLVTARTFARRLFHGAVAVLPPRVATPLLRVFDGFMGGLTAMRSARDVLLATTLSLLLWLNGVAAIRILLSAFDIDLPFGAACFTAVAIALTVVLPQAPGFVGVFHVAIEKTLVLWGQASAPAQAFAILFWGISFVPVTAVGLVALWREGLSLSRVLAHHAPGSAPQADAGPPHD